MEPIIIIALAILGYVAKSNGYEVKTIRKLFKISIIVGVVCCLTLILLPLGFELLVIGTIGWIFFEISYSLSPSGS